MNIRIATHHGLCFGVRDAITRAEALAASGPLTVLGELAHNPAVGARLRALGAQSAPLETDPALITGQVLFTAHGVSDRERARWLQAGASVADATCPLVRHAHEQLRLLVASGFAPVVIGQAGHVEVRGLIGDFPGASVLASEADIPALPAACPLGIIAQTTQPQRHVFALVAVVREARPEQEVRFVDTVCAPTRNRQRALEDLIEECETIVVVGGRHSNNTLQLVQTARQAGRQVVHVENAEEIREGDFPPGRCVGLTAGTSTLPETLDGVRRRLAELGTAHAARA